MIHRFPIWRLAGSHSWVCLVGFFLFVGLVLLIVYLTNRRYKSPGLAQGGAIAQVSAASAAQTRFLAILSEQKSAGAMGAEEFEERRLIWREARRGDNHANEALVALKERYARGELTTGAYIKAKNELI
ncbi:MAG: SHOCT domain-containing protein [Eubacteriales bacterium]